MYGRRAPALANEINKIVATPVTTDDTQKVIDSIARTYPVGWEWLENNAQFAVENEYVENMFGRRRYFQGARDMSDRDQAAVKREAKNSPIQGVVADLLAKAGYMLDEAIDSLKEAGIEVGLRTVLPIHDAFLFEVKRRDLLVALKLITLCMSDDNKLPGTQFNLGIDIEVHPRNWGDHGLNPAKPKDMEQIQALVAAA